jgi:hypothetical protein
MPIRCWCCSWAAAGHITASVLDGAALINGGGLLGLILLVLLILWLTGNLGVTRHSLEVGIVDDGG